MKEVIPMGYPFILRIISVVLAIVALILLVWLWTHNQRNLSFIPFLLIVLALFFQRLYSSKS